MKKIGRILAFFIASAILGLAIAFVIVALRPALIHRAVAPVTPAPTAQARAPGSAPTLPVAARVTYSDAVQRASPAVVNIYTARLVTERINPSMLDELFGDFGPRYRRRVESSLGSGVIVDAQGHIVTNHHVIANADSIRVQLADGRVAEAGIVGRDPDSDLAVLRITLDPLPSMPMGYSDRLKVGDVVLAIGNPLGLSQTVTHGIISATSRGQLGVATYENFLQTDAPINFGNSGGALIDTNGALVGINTAIVAKNLGVEGIGFAIPVNMVRGVLDDIIAHGRVIRGWVGFVPEDITDEQAASFGLAQGGVVIANLYIGSPAQRAGLRPGDLITQIDGLDVRGAQDTLARIASRKPGTRAKIRGLRGRETFEVTVEIGEKPRER